MGDWNVADVLAINNLYAAYTYAVDDHNADAYIDCFTHDAEIEVGSFEFVRALLDSGAPYVNAAGRVIGANNLRAMFRIIPANALFVHLSGNICITRLEAVSGEAKATFVVLAEDGIVEHYGRYLDQLLHCSDGRWRFRERRVIARYERKRKVFNID